jgi:hypothetical protein
LAMKPEIKVSLCTKVLNVHFKLIFKINFKIKTFFFEFQRTVFCFVIDKDIYVVFKVFVALTVISTVF